MRRTRYEIFADLLEIVARKGFCRVTRASYGANLPVDRAKKSLSFLASRGFLKEETRGDSNIYKITKRGLEYLESFKHMRRLFAALDEKTPITEEKDKPSPYIKADLILQKEEAKINEEIIMEIVLHNIGGSQALLVKFEDIIPKSFELITAPKFTVLEDTILYLNGKRLPPSEMEHIKLILKPLEEGLFEIQPKIIYTDDAGRQNLSRIKTEKIRVREAKTVGYLSTGFQSLDNLLLGGIPENYAVILTSTSCDEKDLLIRKFLETGASNDQITFYITTELMGAKSLAEKYQKNLHLFVCNPQAEAIVKSSHTVSVLKGVENLTAINIALTSSFRKLRSVKGSRRVCLEIVSDVLLQHRAVQTRRWLTGLLPELKSEGFTSLMVMNPQMHSSEEVQAILGLFEGEMNIYEMESQRGIRRYLRIKKMYNRRYIENEMLLEKERLRS